MLIFDFDGVLIDSLDEVTLTVYNTARGRLATSPQDMPSEPAALFRRNRFHIQPIGDGVLLMSWCLRNYRIGSERILQPAEYREIIDAAAEPVARRSGQVYEMRRQFIERDVEGKCFEPVAHQGQNDWKRFHYPALDQIEQPIDLDFASGYPVELAKFPDQLNAQVSLD